MTIKKIAVIVSLDDMDGTYQVLLNKEQSSCVIDLLKLLHPSGVQLIDTNIETIKL